MRVEAENRCAVSGANTAVPSTTPAPTTTAAPLTGPPQLPACVALTAAAVTPVNGTFNQTLYFSQPALVRGAPAQRGAA